MHLKQLFHQYLFVLETLGKCGSGLIPKAVKEIMFKTNTFTIVRRINNIPYQEVNNGNFCLNFVGTAPDIAVQSERQKWWVMVTVNAVLSTEQLE